MLRHSLIDKADAPPAEFTASAPRPPECGQVADAFPVTPVPRPNLSTLLVASVRKLAAMLRKRRDARVERIMRRPNFLE